MPEFENIPPEKRLCVHDNWATVLDDPAPRAVRWATRSLVREFNDPSWSKWHYTEGNGSFTACGEVVVPFMVDGSPQEDRRLRKITCKRCNSAIQRKGAHLLDPNGQLT